MDKIGAEDRPTCPRLPAALRDAGAGAGRRMAGEAPKSGRQRRAAPAADAPSKVGRECRSESERPTW